MQGFVRVSDALSRACGAIAMVLLAAAVVVVCEMVFVRYVLRSSTVWQSEFVIYAVVASTFIGAPYVLLHRGHVSVDLVPKLLTGRARLAIDLTAGLLSLLFCAILAWSGWNFFYEALAGGWTTDTVWALPLWIPLLPLPLGVGMLCVQYVAELVRTGADRPGKIYS